MLRKAFTVFAVFGAFTVSAYTYGQKISRLDTWELAFTSKPPRVLEVSEGEGIMQYTYIVYEVKNETSAEIDFYPTFEIENEEGEVFRAGVYPEVHKRLAKRLGEKLLTETGITGTIRPGESKMGVAIFKDADVAADEFSVYVAGLCGDLKTEEGEDGRVITRYRTYKLLYRRPGDEFHASLDPVKLQSTTWVWR